MPRSALPKLMALLNAAASVCFRVTTLWLSFPHPPSDVPIRLNTKYSGKHVFLINLDGYDVEKIRRRCENSHRIPLKIHSESVVARNDCVDLYYDLFSANVL
ncbi:hypothetical protein ACS0PU_004869 [Formica fusca]